MALLDYKVSVGYDFDQRHEEEDERRVADTFRVISLSFSNLGGPEAVGKYYSNLGKRPYEARVYSNLGEHYLGELRYQDAAKTYQATSNPEIQSVAGMKRIPRAGSWSGRKASDTPSPATR